jgi:hypothetical protein
VPLKNDANKTQTSFRTVWNTEIRITLQPRLSSDDIHKFCNISDADIWGCVSLSICWYTCDLLFKDIWTRSSYCLVWTILTAGLRKVIKHVTRIQPELKPGTYSMRVRLPEYAVLCISPQSFLPLPREDGPIVLTELVISYRWLWLLLDCLETIKWRQIFKCWMVKYESRSSLQENIKMCQ